MGSLPHFSSHMKTKHSLMKKNSGKEVNEKKCALIPKIIVFEILKKKVTLIEEELRKEFNKEKTAPIPYKPKIIAFEILKKFW